jgi:hypothetical protein
MHGAICYNITNYIANGPALLQTAGTLSQDAGGIMTSPSLTPPLDSDNLKRCTKCGVEYPATSQYFQRRPDSIDGLRRQCRECRAVEDRKRVHPPRPGRKHKQYPRDPEKVRAYARAYREANRDHVREYQREYDRAYLKTEKGRAVQKAKEQRRRAKERGIDADCSAADLVAIRQAQTDKRGRLICWRCRKPITDTPHLDHFIPFDKGGHHTAGNLHYMHAECNLNKSNKHPHELGMLI